MNTGGKTKQCPTNAGDESGWVLIRCRNKHWFYNPAWSKDQKCPTCEQPEPELRGDVFDMQKLVGTEKQPGVFTCIHVAGHPGPHHDKYRNTW